MGSNALVHSEQQQAGGHLAAEGDKCSVTFPAPLASHQEVLANPSLFENTLQIFHETMGTKYMVPVMGGQKLDLHVLYAEVTKKGGFDKVVKEKKWREVSGSFEFSPTTTSASYALKKHYSTLLRHYELAYFFRLKTPSASSPPPDSPPSPSPSPTPVLSKNKLASSKMDSIFASTGPLCFEAVGTIDGKFDCGYLVSVKLGSEILSGVLYHPDHRGEGPSSSLTPQPATHVVPQPHIPRQPQAPAHSGRRKRKRRGDPGHPKPNRSGYNFFFAEKHSELKLLYPNREREFTKMIGGSWNNLTPEERTVYQNQGLKDKERYQREMKEYKERMNAMNPI